MHMTMQDRLIVDAAVTPVKDLPAPHGSTMMPERALPLPNIFERDFSW
jgi:hypothetical protein